jgi:cell division cycle 2-like protein
MSNGNTANTQADNMNTDERRGVKRRREDETDEQNTIDLTKSESKPQLSRAESALAFRNGTGPVLAGSRSINEFEKIAEIGDGTYGVVFKARDMSTGNIYALKKVKMEQEREGFPMTSLREVKLLMQCKHPHIVNVQEIVVGRSIDDIFIVMEYCENDLKALMHDNKSPLFTLSETKCLMQQMLGAMEYLHENWIIHRDIKTSNLLLNNQGMLKLADFGLAREYTQPSKPMTPVVVTLWYRAPELLLGEKKYGPAIDMWAVGCVMAELLTNEPLFPGTTEFKQLDLMFQTLGTASERIWPGMLELEHARKWNFVNQPYNRLKQKFPRLSDHGFDLLNRLLTYDPAKRISATEALKHKWFEESPLPKDMDLMPTFPPRSDRNKSGTVAKSPRSLKESHLLLNQDHNYDIQDRNYDKENAPVLGPVLPQ